MATPEPTVADTISSNPLDFITEHLRTPYANLSNVSLCLIGAMFIGAGLYTTLKCYDCHPISTFKESLSMEQRYIYEQIVQERQSLYLQGLVCGLFFSSVTLFLTGNSLNPLTSGCVYAGITLIVQYFYYTLAKKSPLMVNYLQSQEQVMLWDQVYTKMQTKWHVGLLLGLIGYAFLPLILRTLRGYLPI